MWNQILSKCDDATPYLTYEWVRTWWEHFGEGHKLLVFLIEDGDEIIGVIPLMTSTLGPMISVIEFIGGQRTPYQNMILLRYPEKCFYHVLQYLEAHHHWTYLEFNNIPEFSKNSNIIEHTAEEHKLAGEKTIIKRSPVLWLNDSWQDYFRTLSGKFRGELNRTQRRLVEIGSLDYEVSTNAIEDLPKFYHICEGNPTFSSEKWRRFHTDLVAKLAPKGWIHLSFLTIDGEAIAAKYGYQFNHTYYGYSSGYDRAYSKYGPGQLHIMYLLQECMENQISKVDFGWGTQRYKLLWQPDIRRIMRHRLISKRLSSKAKYFIGKKLKNLWK